MSTYPRDVKVDFTKLRLNTLKRYAWHYNLPSDRTEKAGDLANTCANHFSMHLEVNEAQVLSQFVDYCKNMSTGIKDDGSEKGSSSGEKDGQGKSPENSSQGDLVEEYRKRKRDHPIATGEKVAAKIGGEWMLTRVIKYSKRKKMYKVEDADEMTKDPAVYDVHQDYLIVLPKPDQPETLPREFPRGARVLALFPGTSTFYAATVAKKFEKPKGRLNEYGLRFDDDEKDANGEVRLKRISAYEVVSPL